MADTYKQKQCMFVGTKHTEQHLSVKTANFEGRLKSF